MTESNLTSDVGAKSVLEKMLVDLKHNHNRLLHFSLTKTWSYCIIQILISK